MSITSINPLQNSDWDAFAASHPLSTIYHHSAWAKVISLSYGYTPRYYVLTDQEGTIRAGAPLFFVNNRIVRNRFIGLPFSDSGDVLTTSFSEAEMLIGKIESDLGEYRDGSLEIRSQNNPQLAMLNTLVPLNTYKTFILPLNGSPGQLRRQFQKSTIERSIKKAEASKLCLRKASSEDDLKAFYHLNLMTRKKHGVPVQPYRFFARLWSVMKPLDLIDINLAYLDNIPVAGIVLLKYRDTVYYKYGASDEKYLTLYRPNHLLMWKAIESACHEGFKQFDFGRTSIDDQGLLEFKKRWGACETPLTYFYYPKARGVNTVVNAGSGVNLAKSLVRHLPLSINRIIGTCLYKYMC